MRLRVVLPFAALTAVMACAEEGAAPAVPDDPVASITEARPGLADRAGIPGDRALAIAGAEFPGGTVVEAEIEEEDGRLVYDIHIKVDGDGEYEVLIDAMTGVVVDVEHEDEDDEDDEDDDDDHEDDEHDDEPEATRR